METIIEEQYKYLIGDDDTKKRNEIRKQIASSEAEKRFGDSFSLDEYYVGTSAFLAGVKWSDANPSLDVLLKVFFILEERGLIKDGVCFDPEQYIETTIIPLYKKYYDR